MTGVQTCALPIFNYYYGGTTRFFGELAPWHRVKLVDEDSNPNFRPYQIWGLLQSTGGNSFGFADGHGEYIQFRYAIDTYNKPPRQDVRINPVELGHDIVQGW